MTLERLDGFTADGFGNVIPGAPQVGDVVRIDGTIEQRYTAPPVPPVPPAPSWNAFDFTRRFTQAERITLRNLAKTNDAAFDFLDLLDKAGATGTMVRSDDPDTVAAVNLFEAAGLIGTGRAAVILGAGASP